MDITNKLYPYGVIRMNEKVTKSELCCKATAELQQQIEEELLLEDPVAIATDDKVCEHGDECGNTEDDTDSNKPISK